MKHALKRTLKFLPLLLLVSLLSANCASTNKDWRTADRSSAGIAPDPQVTQEAVIQVYGARAWSWRGWFAIHTWIAAKRSGQDHYKIYDVVGWRGKRGKPVMQITKGIPDRHWFGEKPELLKDHRGDGVDQLIDQLEQAALSYPWKTEYSVFPGPNSNTFVAWVAKEVPDLGLKLPFRAIGKGYVN